MTNSIRIIITDDKERFRKVLKEIVSPHNIKVIAEAENGQELLNLLNTFKPDVILLDLEMPIMDGNQAFSQIRERFPDLKVIILSLYNESILIEDYIERGVKGYLPKEAIMDNENLLIDAIRKVSSGSTFFFENPENDKRYSGRQKELMPLIFDGKTNEDIAKEIGITKRAVEKQRQKIYKINGFTKAIEFYKYAFSKGLQFLGKK